MTIQDKYADIIVSLGAVTERLHDLEHERSRLLGQADVLKELIDNGHGEQQWLWQHESGPIGQKVDE